MCQSLGTLKGSVMGRIEIQCVMSEAPRADMGHVPRNFSAL
jgi:hypothetical protein